MVPCKAGKAGCATLSSIFDLPAARPCPHLGWRAVSGRLAAKGCWAKALHRVAPPIASLAGQARALSRGMLPLGSPSMRRWCRLLRAACGQTACSAPSALALNRCGSQPQPAHALFPVTATSECVQLSQAVHIPLRPSLALCKQSGGVPFPGPVIAGATNVRGVECPRFQGHPHHGGAAAKP